MRARFDDYLEPLKNYGFDGEMVKRELYAAAQLVRKRDKEDNWGVRMFAAAQVCMWNEYQARKSKREKHSIRQ